MTFVIYIIFVVFIGVWANNIGRNVFGYIVLAFLFSPLVAGIVLAIVGKKGENYV